MKKLIIIIAALPVVAFPALLSQAPAGDGTVDLFLWFYPLYVVASAVCAWICRDKRPEVMWILVVLMLLTHAAMWLLVNPLLLVQ